MSIHVIVAPDGVDLVTILQQIAAQGTETLSRLETLMKTAADFEVELGQLKDALVAANGAKDAALKQAQADRDTALAAEKTAEDALTAAQAAEKKAEDAAAALQAQVDAGVIPDNIAQEVQDIITSLTTPATSTTSGTTGTTGTTGATSVTNPDGSVTTTNPDGTTTTTPPPAEAPVP